MADERTLRALLRFGIDKADVNTAKQGVKDVEQSLKDAERQMDKLRQSGEQLSSVGMRLTAFGAAISGPFILAARSYVQYAGQADASSRRWLAATDDLERSTVRIGKVAAEQLLPVLETAADLMEQVAKFSEDNPGAITAALAVGGLAAGLGPVVSVGGQLVAAKAAADAAAKAAEAAAAIAAASSGATGAAAGAGAAGAAGTGGMLFAPGAVGAAGAGGLTAGGVGLAVGGGVLAGLGVNELLARTVGGPFQTAGKWASVGAYGAGKLLGGEETGKEWFAAISDLTGETQGLTEVLRENKAAAEKGGGDGGGETIIPQAALDAYIAYQQDVEQMEQQHGDARLAIIEDYNTQVEQATQQYEERRAQIIEDFEERRARAVADFERRRDRIERDFYSAREQAAADFAASQMAAAADFSRQENEAERSYYASRARRARDFGIEIERMEEDHQRQMRNLRDDHEARETDLVASRDALGLVRERRSYERQRRTAEDDYRIQASRRSQDFAREMGDMEQQFREQRAMRLEDFQRQQAEAQAAYEARRQQELEEYEQRQADEQEDFDLRQKQEEKHHAEMLLELHDQHTKELRRMYDHRNSVLRELDDRHRRELDRRKIAFSNQLHALDYHLLGEKLVARGYYTVMEADFRNWLQAMRNEIQNSTPTGVPGHQHGGYTRRGLAFMHDREFVLSPNTTSAAERMAGGRLTQESALAMMARTSPQLVLQQNFSFGSRLAADEKVWYKQVAYDQAKQAFHDVMERARY